MALDFSKLGSVNTADTVDNPLKIFQALPNKDQRYSYLRDVQGDVLSRWHERRTESDLLLKMNTGGGKTVVGLLALKSCLNENVGPAAYIAPDNYLVQQVLSEAAQLGIETTTDPRDGRFQSGKSILVINIHKLINGRSVFGVGQEGQKIELGSILIDDAHACIASTEDQFNLIIPNDNLVYAELYALFRDDIRSQSKVAAQEIEQADPRTLAPVPYWAWNDKLDHAIAALMKLRGLNEFDFVWPLLRDTIAQCQCVFGGNRIEISPPCLPINAIPSFIYARRRIYMTATLSNDAVLISDFNANPDTINKPITPKTASDLGDRMVLIPQEINTGISDQDVKGLAKFYSEHHNVVVIVPSTYRAEFWADVAADTLYANNLEDGVARLKAGHVGLVVLVNKYDGVDLPGSACRTLIIDGLPDVRKLSDKVRHSILSGSEVFRSWNIQRVEQGMGRGVRSNDDYCAILLMGGKLIQEVNAANSLKHFSPATAAQISLSRQVAQQIDNQGINEMSEVLNLLFSREPQWVSASKNALIDVAYSEEANLDLSTLNQRRAFDAAQLGRHDEAEDFIQEVIATNPERPHLAWLLQQKATYVHAIDPVRSQRILSAAIKHSPLTFKPIAGVAYKKLDTVAMDQAQQASEFLRRKYSTGSGLRLTLLGILAKLEFRPDSWNEFEQAFCELALHLGFLGQRPEKEVGDGGPDVLWGILDRNFLVISCKNEATSETISKTYAENLSGSITWFAGKYDASCSVTPIIIHPASKFKFDAPVPADTRVINQEKLTQLKDAVTSFIHAVANTRDDVVQIRQQLTHHNLLGANFVNRYSVGFSKENS